MIKLLKGQRKVRLALLLCLFLCISFSSTYAQSGIKLPPPPKTVDLFQDEIKSLGLYSVDSLFFAKPPGKYKRTVTMDSTGEYITVREALDDTEYYFPAVVDLETYVALRLQYNIQQMQKQTVVANLLRLREAEFGAINLDIPFRIKNETFTRIFGSDKISLRVTGNISFDLSGRIEERSGAKLSARENRNTFSPKFTQTQQFTVEGKIGDKVTVSVEQNSEAVTDIENTLKLKYDGDDDEIVESIEAGNVSLSLPSTKYVIFGGSNKGLFGLKTKMRMGNLHMTAIASLEKGEQAELNISGSSSGSTTEIEDSKFIKSRYFFASEYYRNYWEKSGYNETLTQFVAIDGTLIDKLRVFKSAPPQEQFKKEGIAVIDPNDAKWVNYDYESTVSVAAEVYKGNFVELEEGKDFEVDAGRGFFWVKQAVSNNEVLAITFATKNGNVGSINWTDASDNKLLLKLIKDESQSSNDTYAALNALMMRNVYSIGGNNIEKDGFDITIQNKNDETFAQGDDTYLTLTGLDILDENSAKKPNDKVDLNPYFVNLADGVLIFPNLRPFAPKGGKTFGGGFAEDNRAEIYDNDNATSLNKNSLYKIIVKSKSSQTVFQLGFYVLEGSEVVTLNGNTLVRDKDYVIDYFSGTLNLTSDQAKRSSSEISIKYERANLFQLDKKTLFGGRLEYNFDDESFVGLTALYLNKSTLDKRVRVGQEPFQNFVWDVNAAFKFKPRFLTDMVDALPFIETNTGSEWKVEGEFAQVLPDPNTLNNAATGDNNGVAYVDDFESSKRTTTLGIRYRAWSMASAPAKLEDGVEDPLAAVKFDKTRAHLTWFNPYDQTLIESIWPDRDTNSQTGTTTDVLGLEYYRDKGTDADSAWVGIMRSTISIADQQNSKYLELWVQGTEGKLHIDLGTISEDWYVSENPATGQTGLNFLNTEDKDGLGYLDENEDTGIDGIASGQPGDSNDDDWYEVVQNPKNWPFNYDYRGLNRTEGNSQISGAKYPDTEDLDGNNSLNTKNHYYTYSFSLDPNDVEAAKWIVGATRYKSGPLAGQLTGWRQFRIPLGEATDSVGVPDKTFQSILFTRLRVSQIPVYDPDDSNTSPTRIRIATFDFVGNEWLEDGYRDPSTATDSTVAEFVKDESIFTLTTYNTEENKVKLDTDGAPDPYVSPPGVSGVKDRITKAVSKEQSLVIKMNDLPAGNEVQANKTLYTNIDLINYKKLKLFLYGSINSDPQIPINTDIDSSKIEFYIRFGSDDNNFYEYGQRVYQQWNKLNKVEIDLAELAGLNGIGEGEVRYLGNTQQSYYRAKGTTVSLNRIRYFIIGVRNKHDEPFSGEIWLDELRVADVRKQAATALRLRTSVKLADLMVASAEWESKDADFHNVSKQFGEGSTTERQNYTASIRMDKFLPHEWELSIPVDARASFSRQVPKYRPRSDDLTGYNNNTVSKKLKSLFGLSDLPDTLKSAVNVSESIGFGVSFKKVGKSQHWLPKYTIDNMSLDLDYHRQFQSSFDIAYNRSEKFTDRFSYTIPFGQNNYWEPLKFARAIPILKEFWNTKIYYTPQNIKFGLSVSDSHTKLRRRTSTTVSDNRNTATTRTLSTAYRPINSVNFNYNRTLVTDVDYDSISRSELYGNIIKRFDFGLLTSARQTFSGDFKPKLLSWISPTFNYSNNFTYSVNTATLYKRANSSTTKRVSANISPDKLVNLIWSPKDKKKSGGRRRGRARSKTKTKTDEENSTSTKKDEGFNPLIYIYNVFDSWKSVKVSYSYDNAVANDYLSGMPDYSYQFGFTRNPGVGQDLSILDRGEIQFLPSPTLSSKSGLRTSTQVKVGNYVNVSLSHDYRTNNSVSNNGRTRSGGESSTYLALDDDPGSGFDDVTGSILGFVPDWNVTVNGLHQLGFIKSFAKSMNLTHAHSGKFDERKAYNTQTQKLEWTSRNFTNNWTPLIGVSLKTVWGVSGNFRYNLTSGYAYKVTGGVSKNETSSMNFTLAYSTQSGFKIPLPFWPFKGRTFKNEITFNLTFDLSENKSFGKTTANAPFKELTRNSSWKFRPSASYRFSSRVNGSLFYEQGETDNKHTGTFSYSEFGINVNIAIRD